MKGYSRISVISCRFIFVISLLFAGFTVAYAQFGSSWNQPMPGNCVGYDEDWKTCITINGVAGGSLKVPAGRNMQIGWHSEVDLACHPGQEERHDVTFDASNGAKWRSDYGKECGLLDTIDSETAGSAYVRAPSTIGSRLTYRVTSFFRVWVAAVINNEQGQRATMDIEVVSPITTATANAYCVNQSPTISLSINSEYAPRQYQISRRRTAPGTPESFSVVATISNPGAGLFTWEDPNVTGGFTYEYRVQPVGYNEVDTSLAVTASATASATCQNQLAFLEDDEYVVTVGTTRILDVTENDFSYRDATFITDLEMTEATRGGVSVVREGNFDKIRYVAPSTKGPDMDGIFNDGFNYAARNRDNVSGSATVRIDLVDQCSVSFINPPASVQRGDAVTLRWQSTNIQGNLSSGGSWTGFKTPSGSQQVTIPLSGTVSYTLSGTNGALGGGCAIEWRPEISTISEKPVARDDNDATTRNTIKTVDVLGNDVYQGETTIRFFGSSSTARNGQVSLINGGSSVRYTPPQNFVGSDSFQYYIIDSTLNASDPATVTITVSDDPNLPPNVSITSPADGASFTLGSTVVIQASASDVDGTVTRVQFFRNMTNSLGTDTNSPYSVSTNSLTVGTHVLTAVATDNDGATRTSSPISITITPPLCTPPSVTMTSPANGASYQHGTMVVFSANATDPDDAITQVEFLNGSSVMGRDTSAPYSRSSNTLSVGAHILRARATNDCGAQTLSDPVVINITSVTPTNTPPDAWDDYDTANVNEQRTVAVLENDEDFDGDPLTVTSVSLPGSLYLNNTVRYTAPSSAGTYSFPYSISDGRGGTDTALVRVTVVDTPPPPVGQCAISSLSASPSTVNAGGSFTLSWDAQGVQGLQYVRKYQNGNLVPPNTSISNSARSYNVNVPSSDSGTYTYQIMGYGSNGSQCYRSVNVTVSATPPVEACSINTFSAPSTAGAGETVSLSWSSSNDADGRLLATGGTVGWPSSSKSASGSQSLTMPSATGRYTYSLQCIGADNNPVSRSVSIDVGGTEEPGPVGSPPDAVNDSVGVRKDESENIYVTRNDTFQAPATISITSHPSRGSATVATNSSGEHYIRYTPNSGYVGSDSIGYRLSDSNGSDTATVSINVYDSAYFNLDILADVASLSDGTHGSVTIPIEIHRIGGYDGEIILQMARCGPTWVPPFTIGCSDYTFIPQRIPGSETDAVVEISSSIPLPEGEYQIQVRGTGHSPRTYSSSDTFTLSIGTSTTPTAPDVDFEEF